VSSESNTSREIGAAERPSQVADALEAWEARTRSPRLASRLAQELLASGVEGGVRDLARATLAVAKLALNEPAVAIELAAQVSEAAEGAWEPGLPAVGAVVTEARLTELRAAYVLDDVAGALRLGRESLVLAKRYALPLLAARAHNDLAAVYGSRDLLDMAVKHLKTGIAILEAAGEPVAPSLLTNLGNVYLDTKRLDEGLACFERGRAGFLARDDRFGAGIARSNEGRALGRLGRHREAIAALEEALGWFAEVENRRYYSVTQAKLAQAQADAGDNLLAERLFKEAIAGLEEPHDGFEAEIRAGYGDFLLTTGRPAEALEELSLAAELFRAADKHKAALGLERQMAAALAAQGRFHEAYETLDGFLDERGRTEADHSSQVLTLLLTQLEVGLGDEHELNVVARQAVIEANQNLREQAERLESLSTTDDLTGLFNRRYFRGRLTEEEERADRHGHDLVVVLVDVDNFKRVNDDHSHSVGDEVLARMAQLLKRAFRASDVVARWGGEEFVALLPGSDKAAAHEAAERARALVAEHYWDELAPGLAITVSVGVAALSEVAEGDPEQRVSDLVKLVDTRLYTAKRDGRNRTQA